MPGKKQDQRSRAERLREEIERMKTGADTPVEPETQEPLPGESPKEYVERRQREIANEKKKKKRTGK
jgi:hypothetical protein